MKCAFGIVMGLLPLSWGVRAQAPIVLPVEVFGPNGYVRDIPFQIESPTADIQTLTIVLEVHGLKYPGQGAFQLNDSRWIPLTDEILMPGAQIAYGGIGGGFSTLRFRKRMLINSLFTGNNRIRFRFVATDGNSSGFRVLDFNLLAVTRGGKAEVPLLAPSYFVTDDPGEWAAPSGDSSDKAEGERLWRQAPLTVPASATASRSISAHCSDCHTDDGRDLKYFNYSNYSIEARAVFHGLTAAQGSQIASYIRSLKVSNPGRPWNPPYQPGPGLDSQPVGDWAAGAGLGAVLSSDAAMLPYVAPTETAADFNPNGNLSIRNTPIAYQLPDWNNWLPRIHPKDAFGSAFLNSTALDDYTTLSKSLSPNSPSVYLSMSSLFANWSGDTTNFRGSVEPGQSDPSWSKAQTAESIYGIQQWQIVKMWELNQVFGLEGMAQTVFGRRADSRAWYTNAPFQTSPSIIKIPPGSPGIHNGTLPAFNEVSFAWYYLQMILNNSNKQEECTNPVDFGYLYGFIGGQANASQPQAALFLTILEKALQISQNGYGPQYGCVLGWQWAVNDPSFLVNATNINGSRNIWSGVSPSTAAALINAYMTQWLATVRQFTPQEFYTGGTTSPTESLTESWYGPWAGRVAFMLPHLLYEGMNQSQGNQIAAWAQTMWPGYNWTEFATATCTVNSGGYVVCSSDSLLQ